MNCWINQMDLSIVKIKSPPVGKEGSSKWRKSGKFLPPSTKYRAYFGEASEKIPKNTKVIPSRLLPYLVNYQTIWRWQLSGNANTHRLLLLTWNQYMQKHRKTFQLQLTQQAQTSCTTLLKTLNSTDPAKTKRMKRICHVPPPLEREREHIRIRIPIGVRKTGSV